MIGLEKNRVFDTRKIATFNDACNSLLCKGITACEEWDIAVKSLNSLNELVPGEIKSVELATALSGVATPLSNPEYENIRLRMTRTLGKLSKNMPECDAEASDVIKYLSIATNMSIAMIQDLKSYLLDVVYIPDIFAYNDSMWYYFLKWKEAGAENEKKLEEAQSILKGLPKYTYFYGDPVNMETGNFTYCYTDLQTEGDIPFGFTRFYNAMDKHKGVLGRGWIHNYESRLVINDTQICLYHEDGREENFVLQGRKPEQEERIIFRSCEDGRSALLQMYNEYYYLDDRQRMKVFDKEGKLTEIRREDNKKITLLYEEEKLACVKADTGEYLLFQYDESGQLIQIKDFIGRMTKFTFNKKKLVKVTDAQGRSFQYEYGKNGRIERMIDKRGITVLKNSYDNDKRIITQEFPDGGIMKFEYHDRMNRVCVTEQNGNQIVYTHDNKHRNIETLYEDSKEIWFYDENNNCKAYTDRRRNTTRYEYNRNGQIIGVTDALSNRTTAEYDEEGKLLKMVNPDGGEVCCEYDSEGRMTVSRTPLGRKFTLKYHGKEKKPEMVFLPDGSRLCLRYDEKGNICAIDYPDGTGMAYTYDDLNRVVESLDNNGNLTRFAYDTMSRITRVVRADGAEKSYRYNEMGEALEITDFDGYTATWEYNALNKPQSYTDKCGRKTTMEYDIMWNLSRVTDPEGGTTEYIYNRMNRLEKVINNSRQTIEFLYDENGNRTEIHYPDRSVIKYKYDKLNRLIAMTDESGNITRTCYDCMGNVSRVVDAAGNVTCYEYDKEGNRIREIAPDGGTTLYTYTVLGKLETITDPVGRICRYCYGQGGRLSRIENEDGTWEAYDYDKAGNIICRRYQDGSSLSYRYDCLNRVIEIRRGVSLEKACEYDAMGNILAVTDALGNRTEYRYSPEGKLTKVIDPLGNTARYFYNKRDEITGICRLSKEEERCFDRQITDIQKLNESNHPLHLTVFERNTDGRIEKVTDESGRETAYRYDIMGRVILRTDENGGETSYQYHPGGRIRETGYPDGTSVAFSYDALYRLSCIKDWLGETEFTYDAMGRMAGVTDPNGERVEYGFYPDGSRRFMKYPDGRKADYCYDAVGRLSRIICGKFCLDYRYDVNGKLAEIRRGNGIGSSYSYDREGRLAEIVHRDKTGILESFSYSYDAAGNRTGTVRLSVEQGYGFRQEYRYDSLNRLVAVYGDGELLRQYDYDAYGNRRPGEGTAVPYDYVLDGVNRMVKLQDGNGRIQENVFNGLGCLAGIRETGTSPYLWQYTDYTDEYKHVIMESSEGRRCYLWQGGMLLGMPGEESYVLTDILHTPVCVTDREGKVKNRYRYDEYGIPEKQREEIPLPFGFTGYRKDAVPGLYHANAREYDSRLGRFLTRDSFRYMNYEDPVSLNLYQYACGNPLRYLDPGGHECIEEHAWRNKTIRHILLGNLTEDVTLAGIMADIGLGLMGLDLPMDIRDITADFTVNFNPTEISWWGMTAVDCLSAIPLVGVCKYFDEIGAWGKNTVKGVSKNWDSIADGVKHADNLSEVLDAVFSLGRKNSDEAAKSIREVVENANKHLDEIREAEKGIAKGVESGKTTVIYGSDDIANYQYNMIENPGPLAEMPNQPAKNFYGGRYNMEVLQEDRIMYRAGNAQNPYGRWFTSEPPASVANVRIDTAVKTHWIDPKTGAYEASSYIDNVYAIKVPKGTTIYTGPVGPQGGVYVGGYNVMQTYIDAPWTFEVVGKTPLQ